MSEPAPTPPPDTPYPASPVAPLLDDDALPAAAASPPSRDPGATSPAPDVENDDGRPRTPTGKQPPVCEFNTPVSVPSNRPLASGRNFQSQDVGLATLKTEAGTEASRLHVGPVSMKDFMRLTFQRHFSEVVEDVSQRISPDDQARVSARLSKIPPGEVVERKMYTPLKEGMNDMCSSLWKENSPIELETVESTKDPQDPGTPDLIIKESGMGLCPWPCALAFVEVKPQDKQDPFYYTDGSSAKVVYDYQLKVWDQISYYATVSFRRRPRCFLCGIGVFGNRARFFRFDRSSILVSEAFEYKENPEPLWQFLAGFGAQGYYGSGVDPTIDFEVHDHDALLLEKIQKARAKRLLSEETEKLHDDTLRAQSSTIRVPSKDGAKLEQYITVGPPLVTSTALLGRGTCTWLAFPVPGTVENPERSNEDHFVIIKDSWRDPTRRLEGDIYDIIHGGKDHVPGVARKRSDVDLVEPPDPNSEMHRTLAHVLNTHILDKNAPRKCPPRVHHRCILNSVGIHLSRFLCTREALEAIYDSLLRHEQMSKKDILHRDISVNNIMISAYPEVEKCKGFLIDVEYATVVGEPGSESDLREITGTIQFLSIARLRKTPQLPAHETWNDLESYFWTIAYLYIHHRPHTLSEQVISEIFALCHPDLRTTMVRTHVETMEILCGPDENSEGGARDQRENVPLTSCIRRLAELVKSHYQDKDWIKKAYATFPDMFFQLTTHETIKEVIREALDCDRWPSNDGATPFRLIQAPEKAVHANTAANLVSGIESSQTSESGSKRKRDDDEGSSAKRARPTGADGQAGETETGIVGKEETEEETEEEKREKEKERMNKVDRFEEGPVMGGWGMWRMWQMGRGA
ncbi:hypothetical protein GLOTRDRAFT_133918 [Gloeophyllum trabeum ATCC 11539]|uniref:Fungal-type protein kinase domain-containing protein n=1 Tax=Gloeophyllum trabeum (strain ATCC 11539 / FP-39264 / Madison 617) TaxID=670483 RepID=S7PTC1_GLOTA|nr:uncharacterized protein GLOTRDRAFT_133918 [Gloeophyllum trabeum ATCC 11539]EPQ50552.1 hypothetical protein GLOTRDRAFT_133918 [Gloeophyllum trabeum ATCC 11539]